MISYFKTVLESLISRKKSCRFSFSGLGIFMAKILLLKVKQQNFVVKFSFEIIYCQVKQQNCRAKCKLPYKSPGQAVINSGNGYEKTDI